MTRSGWFVPGSRGRMSNPQPTAFSEADEQLFQKARNQLLGRTEETATADPAAPAPEDVADQVDTPTQRPRRWSMADAWRKASPWQRLLVSFLGFIGLGLLAFTPLEMAWLVGVLLLHETGHYLGMRYFGYRNLGMFFIPLFGAAVQGEKKGVPAWQEAIVLLLGPLPGLVLGCGIYFLDLAVPQPFLREGASWLVAINFLNLLPFEPLDGGRLCNRLLFSRFRWVEAVTVVLATVGLVFVCIGPGWICLSLSGAFALFVLAPGRYKTATAALTLQSHWPDLPPELADLSEEQWRDLFLTARGKLRSLKLIASQMKIIHARALQHPDSGPVTLGLFAVYLSAILLGIVTASVTHLGADAGRWPIRIRHQVTGEVEKESPSEKAD